MEKNIVIDINTKYELVERYNDNKVAHEMIKYIIKEAMIVKSYDIFKIEINKKCELNYNVTKLIKEGLEDEYSRSLNQYHSNNKKQLFFLFLGFVLIFFATQIKEKNVWREMLLISGWVPIWEMVEVELFPDVYGRRKRRIIKKLLNSEFIEK